MVSPIAAKKYNAFSMIEILIVLVVVAVAYIGIMYLHTQITRESSISALRMQSINYAWEEMDSLRNINNITTYQAYTTHGTPPYNYSGPTVVGQFTITQKIISVSTNPNYVVVEGDSTWTDPNGNPHTDKFRTIIPETNPADILWYFLS